SLEELSSYIHNSMPPAAPGSLSDADYAAILAFQMRENGAQAGDAALPADIRRLAGMAVPGQRTASGEPGQRSFASVSTRHGVPEWPAAPDRFANWTPVTQAELSNPPPQNWTSWRRA